MTKHYLAKWGLLGGTVATILFIVVFYTVKDGWHEGFTILSLSVVLVIGMIVSMFLMFIRPIRRLIYPFAPGLWGLGMIVIYGSIFRDASGWILAGFAILVPSFLFMYFIFWNPTTSTKK